MFAVSGFECVVEIIYYGHMFEGLSSVIIVYNSRLMVLDFDFEILCVCSNCYAQQCKEEWQTCSEANEQ